MSYLISLERWRLAPPPGSGARPDYPAMWRGLAAIRDFDPACDRSGSRTVFETGIAPVRGRVSWSLQSCRGL